MERKRLIAERFHRIWELVEFIAREPGKSRRELAQRFALSERQVQADLNVIRTEMRLPLVRRQGYRLAPQTDRPAGVLEMLDAQLLLLLLRRAQVERTVPPQQLARLIDKLPTLFPPHLQPLIAKMVLGKEPTHQQEHFETLMRAILNGGTVRLHYPRRRRATSAVAEPEVQPELLLPYLDSWYLIGKSHPQDRLMMFELDTVDGVNDAD